MIVVIRLRVSGAESGLKWPTVGSTMFSAPMRWLVSGMCGSKTLYRELMRRFTAMSRPSARITRPFGANIRTLRSRNSEAYRDPEKGVLTAMTWRTRGSVPGWLSACFAIKPPLLCATTVTSLRSSRSRYADTRTAMSGIAPVLKPSSPTTCTGCPRRNRWSATGCRNRQFSNTPGISRTGDRDGTAGSSNRSGCEPTDNGPECPADEVDVVEEPSPQPPAPRRRRRPGRGELPVWARHRRGRYTSAAASGAVASRSMSSTSALSSLAWTFSARFISRSIFAPMSETPTTTRPA